MERSRPPELRETLERLIEAAIDLLDQVDGDCDNEDSLGEDTDDALLTLNPQYQRLPKRVQRAR